jgi:protein TonB
MRRNRLFALAILVMVSALQPARSFGQDTSDKETYDGEALCQNRRGVYPRAIYTPDPEYDDKARKKKIEGTVTLSVIVTKEGRTADIKVVKTLTPGLDQQAMKAVSRWKFEPATQDGQLCPMHINVQVQFKLY